MTSPYCVSVTGGVASGKTALTRRFEALGIRVADADIAARTAVAPGSVGLAAIVETFGSDVLDQDGALDRAAMRRRVFDDAAARHRLEAIVHPQVRALLHAECLAASGPYVVAAIPLLAEGGGRDAYPWLDRVLVVDAPVDAQRARLTQRDGIDSTLADRMIASQATRAARLSIADDVIVNTGTLAALDAHVDALDAHYRVLAAARAAGLESSPATAA
ncbi:dephospho-CoA kinase [Cognatilysobacter bugurensis]|uniref:dephospho-CoA kinase n=1 Tax=Cognatilysobacter bugurensis TaxID=543356 RepID=UPI0016756D02|nr:dephospho-CoA kinase [Lysobacter bugurensis]